jgi:hypothetical protein
LTDAGRVVAGEVVFDAEWFEDEAAVGGLGTRGAASSVEAEEGPSKLVISVRRELVVVFQFVRPGDEVLEVKAKAWGSVPRCLVLETGEEVENRYPPP